MGSITKVISAEVQNVTWRFCPFFHLESLDNVSKDSLSISTLSYSRTVSCSASAFYVLSYSLSKCCHAFCHARGVTGKWHLSRSFYASPAKWRENNGAKMTSRSRKKFPVQVREAKRVKITLPRFSFLTAADFSKKRRFWAAFLFSGTRNKWMY